VLFAGKLKEKPKEKWLPTVVVVTCVPLENTYSTVPGLIPTTVPLKVTVPPLDGSFVVFALRVMEGVGAASVTSTTLLLTGLPL